MSKPIVWLVDDLRCNREKFKRDHSKHFNVRVFKSTDAVQTALKSDQPDALLCDIYFFDDEREAQQVEEKIKSKAEELRNFADKELHVKECQTGIKLMEQIKECFHREPPFPIFAYTSKGPYLLENEGFNKIIQTGARWIFKGKLGVQEETMIINKAIAEDKRSLNKVFLVHGRNTEIRNRVDRFLKKLGLEVIILDKKAIQGLTIIENIERYSDVRFAVVLMTGDDMGGLKEDAAMVLKPRARQNVIFELGFFFGRLGRKGKVCVLYEKNVEIFSDYGGVVFVGLKERTWKNKLRTAIKKAGLKIRSK